MSRHADARCAALGGALCALLATLPARSSVVEEVIHVPVQMEHRGAPPVAQDVIVRVVRPADTTPHPFLILNHGRPPEPERRIALGMVNYPANAGYFADLGFVVLIPTRIGYGVTHGPDLEYTGPCADKRFVEGVEPAVLELRAIRGVAARLPYVDAANGIVVGESFGGLVAVAAASDGMPGVRGVVNVAGGDGGDSIHRPDTPCRPDQMEAAFRAWGTTAKVPTLWLYSANDRFWGERLPKGWFDSYVRAGGRGKFIELAADRNNGHFIFTRNPPAWHPAFEQFIAALGLGISERARPSATQ